ncbi:MAG: hypothetical protein V2A58_12560 [Planctomycetota bacterium]
MRAADQDGNVYEGIVRAGSEGEAVAALRARGLIDAEAEVAEGERTPAEGEVERAWGEFVKTLGRLPRGGRGFGAAIEEAAAIAQRGELDLRRESYGAGEDAEEFLRAVKEGVGRTGRAPDLEGAYAAQASAEERWRLAARPTFTLLGTVLGVLAALWGVGVIIVWPTVTSVSYGFFVTYDIRFPGMASPAAMEIFVVLGWVVFLGILSNFVAYVLWRGGAEGVGERWPLLGRVLRARSRGRFLAAHAVLAESGIEARQAARIAAELSRSRRMIKRAQRIAGGDLGAGDYSAAVKLCVGKGVGEAALDARRLAYEASDVLSAQAENGIAQTGALCARAAVAGLGVSTVLAGLWIVVSVWPGFAFISLMTLMNQLGGK